MEARVKFFVLAFCFAFFILISGCVQQGSRPQGSTQNISPQQTDISTTNILTGKKTFATSPIREMCFVINNTDIGCSASMQQLNDSHVTITLNIVDSKNGPRERHVYQTVDDYFIANGLTEEEFNELKLTPSNVQLTLSDAQKIIDYSWYRYTFHGYCGRILWDISKPVVLQCPIDPIHRNLVLVYFKIGKTVNRPVDERGMPDLNWNPPAEDGPCYAENAYVLQCYEDGVYVAVVR